MPGIILAHGYMANLGMMESAFVRALVQRGFVVLNLDRSGHGRSSGSSVVRPQGSRIRLQDFDPEMRAAIAYLRGLSIVDPDRIALVGHSDGARAAIMAACADWSIAATVAISATLHPGDWINAVVPKNLLFVYGSDEAFVTEADRANLFAQATDGHAIVDDQALGDFQDGDAREFVSIKQATHVGVIYDAEAQRRVVEWLIRSLQWRSNDSAPIAAPFLFLGMAMVGMVFVLAGILGVLPALPSPQVDARQPNRAPVGVLAVQLALFVAATAGATRLGMQFEPLIRWLPLDGSSWFSAMPVGLGASLLAVSPIALLVRRLDGCAAAPHQAAARYRMSALVGFSIGVAVMVAAGVGATGWYEPWPSIRKLWYLSIYVAVFLRGFGMVDLWTRAFLLHGVTGERTRRLALLGSLTGCALIFQVSGLPPAPGIVHVPFYLMTVYLLIYAGLSASVAFSRRPLSLAVAMSVVAGWITVLACPL